MISSGAVSPMTRAIASMTPVMMPAERGRQHDLDDGAPLRHAQGVRRLAQLVRDQLEHLLGERTTTGIISSDSATDPPKPIRTPAPKISTNSA